MDIKSAEIILFGHRQAFGGTDGCTESAKAAFTHVDVKTGGIDTFGSSVRCFAEFLRRPNRLDGNAVYWTNFYTFVADYAVFNFIM